LPLLLLRFRGRGQPQQRLEGDEVAVAGQRLGGADADVGVTALQGLRQGHLGIVEDQGFESELPDL